GREGQVGGELLPLDAHVAQSARTLAGDLDSEFRPVAGEELVATWREFGRQLADAATRLIDPVVMPLRQGCKQERSFARFVPPRAQRVRIVARAVERIEIGSGIAAHVNITSKGRAA